MIEMQPRSVLTDGDSDLGYRIVTEVARMENADPLDLDAPLYEAINVDALASLIGSAGDGASVSFRYCGHRVDVDGDGTVTVGDPGVDGKKPGE